MQLDDFYMHTKPIARAHSGQRNETLFKGGFVVFFFFFFFQLFFLFFVTSNMDRCRRRCTTNIHHHQHKHTHTHALNVAAAILWMTEAALHSHHTPHKYSRCIFSFAFYMIVAHTYTSDFFIFLFQ